MVTFKQDSPPATPSAPPPDEARVEIARVTFDSTDLYHAQHAGKLGHDERVAEVAKLFEAAYPEPSAAGQEPPASDARSDGEKESAPIGPEALEKALGPRDDGQPWNGQVVQASAEFAQDVGVPVADVAAILKHCDAQLSVAPSGRAETLAGLAQEWGDEAARNAVAAQLAARRLEATHPGVFDLLDDLAFGDDPVVVRWFARVGRPLLEAAEQIAKVHQDKAHPYNQPGHRQHHQAVEELQALYRKVYGTRRME